MDAIIGAAKREFSSVRTGRANPALLDRVTVDYYGTETPLNQLAAVSAPEPRLLTIQPWDKSQIAAIEKGILLADLGLTPSNDGNVIRIAIPQLTEERRRDLVKVVRKIAEDMRVQIRNARRDANETIKAFEKDGEVPADAARRAQEQIQALTDKHTKQIDELVGLKEKEIMEV